MGRSLVAVGIALGFASLHVGCGGGTLGGGGGSAGGSAGAGGSVVLTGMGGSVIPTGMGGGVAPSGAGGDPWVECLRPQLATPLPPNFLIALDTSATMNSLSCAIGCGSASRWQIAVDAINATTSASEHIANWGLQLFADPTNVCGAIDAVGVPFGPGAAQKIATALATRTTAGGDLVNPGYRPTRNAMANAAGTLARQTTVNASFVVLVTTGLPGCAAGAGDPLADDSAVAVQEITKAFNVGIPTFVVGLGTMDGQAQASLLYMAAAGGGVVGGPAGGGTGYFAVTSSVELQTVLRSLVNDNSGCTFAVPPPPNQYVSRDGINVSLGGVAVLRDANNGWAFTDSSMTAFQLYGTACDVARADRTQPPEIRFACLLP